MPEHQDEEQERKVPQADFDFKNLLITVFRGQTFKQYEIYFCNGRRRLRRRCYFHFPLHAWRVGPNM